MPGPMGGPGRNAKGYAKPENILKTIIRTFHYMVSSKRRAILLIVAILLILLSAAGTIGATFLLTPAINVGIAPLIGTSSLTTAKLMPFIRIVVLMGISYLVGILGTWGYNFIMVRLSTSTLYQIREELFSSVEDLPLVYFDTHTNGDIMSRFTNDVDTLREALSNALPQLLSAALTIIGTLVMMLILSWHLSLVILGMMVLMILVTYIIGKQSRKSFKEQQKALGIVNGYVEEMISGQKVIKVFNHEKQAEEKFDELNENLRKASTKANSLGNILMPIMGNLSYATFAICSGIGGWLIIRGTMTVGAIASFLQYSRNFSQPITMISQLINTVLNALAGAERIFNIIDLEPEEDNGYIELVNIEEEDGKFKEVEYNSKRWAWRIPGEKAWKLPKGEHYQYVEIKGNVKFNNVDFSYDGKRQILKNISLYANPGQKIAFVGSTGAGKTTITNLLNRFYEIESGEITYDGVNIQDIKKRDLRASLAMVLQDTHLFTGTIAENIRYGNLGADDRAIEQAAQLANATHFIRQLPDGFNTMITDDGESLSQGQRQLLSIARAAVADPPVLVLDEATSSIDTMTEKVIEKGMDSLMRGRTVFVIAHRLSTVRNANAILVLDHGSIIERGNHEQLMEQKGRYYELQTGALELE